MNAPVPRLTNTASRAGGPKPNSAADWSPVTIVSGTGPRAVPMFPYRRRLGTQRGSACAGMPKSRKSSSSQSASSRLNSDVREALAGSTTSSVSRVSRAIKKLPSGPIASRCWASASRTSLFNLELADWDDALLRLFGIPAQALPRCVPRRRRYGNIGTARGPVQLTLVTGDQSAALFGFGPPARDAVFVSLGTGAFIQQPIDARPAPSRLLTSLAFDDGRARCYTLEGTVNGAGSALAWACASFNTTEQEVVVSLPAWLSQERSPLLLINAVAGLGSPHWCATLRPQFIGDGDAAAKLVAVIESIVFLIQTNLDAMNEVTRRPVHALIVSGGLARLDGLCQRLADLSGM